MKLIIDTVKKTLERVDRGRSKGFDLYSKEAFELISRQWLKVGWSQKYSYTFTWMGRPIIQHPEDILRIQEVLFELQPDIIIETGVAHGGSLILYASLCQLMGKGKVIGVDIEIRPHNRKAIEAHPMKPWITLIEGSSIDPKTVGKVKKLIKPKDKVLVILDSDHTKEHVRHELDAYFSFVSPGSYLVVTDGIITDLKDVPQNKKYRVDEGPCEAAQEFLKKHPEFTLQSPHWRFNESPLTENVTCWPGAWLKRK